jgi:hypothetical protein
VTKNHTAVKAHVEMGYVMPIRPATAAKQIVATHTSAENTTAEGTEPIIANDANVLARQKNGVTDTATTEASLTSERARERQTPLNQKPFCSLGVEGGKTNKERPVFGQTVFATALS